MCVTLREFHVHGTSYFSPCSHEENIQLLFSTRTQNTLPLTSDICSYRERALVIVIKTYLRYYSLLPQILRPNI